MSWYKVFVPILIYNPLRLQNETSKSRGGTRYLPYVFTRTGSRYVKRRIEQDIDLSIERNFLGFAEDLSKSQVKRLKRVATEFTSITLRDAVEQQIRNLGVPGGMVTVTANPVPETMRDTDQQTLRINYPSLLDPVPYYSG